MGTLRGFPFPPALWLRRAKPACANAIMGTLRGFPFPPTMVRRRRGRARNARGGLGGLVRPEGRRSPHAICMGTLRGFPFPPTTPTRPEHAPRPGQPANSTGGLRPWSANPRRPANFLRPARPGCPASATATTPFRHAPRGVAALAAGLRRTSQGLQIRRDSSKKGPAG